MENNKNKLEFTASLPVYNYFAIEIHTENAAIIKQISKQVF